MPPLRSVRTSAGPLSLAAAGTRPCEAIAYTGAMVDVGNGPEVFDIAGIEPPGRVPFLADHEDSRVAGYSVAADVVLWRSPDGPPDAPLLPALRLLGLLFADEAEGGQVSKRSDQGFPQQVSVRLEVIEEERVPAGETRHINGRAFAGPFIHVKKSRLREASFVSLGADADTRAVALAAAKKKETPMPADAPPLEEEEKEEEMPEAAAKVPATVAEMQAAFPDHAAFCMEQLGKGASLAEAQGAFNSVLSAEVKAEREARMKAEKKASAAASGTRVPAIRPAAASVPAEDDAPDGSPLEQFRAKVREARATGLSPAKATARVARMFPELHAQVLANANPNKPEPEYRTTHRAARMARR